MKTKQIAPWNLKAGMKIVLPICENLNHSFHVESVTKGKSRFTGASVWRVRYTDPQSSLGYGITGFHGRGRGIHGLPLEKATIKID